jgi:phosphotransferase system enzyme I (PtsI)
MEKLTGASASPGIAIGVAYVLGSRVEVHERRIGVDAVESELRRFDAALSRTDAQLAKIQEQVAEREHDDHQYRILEPHRLMLQDVHLVDVARKIIREQQTGAEWAVRKALDQIQSVFDRIEDPYFRDRSSDIAVVGERLLRNLMGMVETDPGEAPAGSIVVAHDLSPADAAQLGRAEVAGICTEGGGRTSHTAIVARALGMPYVVAVEGLGHKVWSGVNLVIDGTRGEVIVDPDDAALRLYNERSQRQRARAQHLASMRDTPAQTKDGVRVHLAANIELMEEIPAAVDLGAESVGSGRRQDAGVGPHPCRAEPVAGVAVDSILAASTRHLPHAAAGVVSRGGGRTVSDSVSADFGGGGAARCPRHLPGGVCRAQA